MTEHVVYELYHGDDLLYVGCTKNVDVRLDKHRRNGVAFDGHTVVVFDGKRAALDHEKRLIRRLQPPLNVRHKAPKPRPACVTNRAAIRRVFGTGGEIAQQWASNVSLIRSTRGLSKAQLASRAGVSPSEITRVENGERTPGDSLKCLIASALNMPVERLFPMPSIERINEMFLADEAAVA